MTSTPHQQSSKTLFPRSPQFLKMVHLDKYTHHGQGSRLISVKGLVGTQHDSCLARIGVKVQHCTLFTTALPVLNNHSLAITQYLEFPMANAIGFQNVSHHKKLQTTISPPTPSCTFKPVTFSTCSV